MVVGPTKWESRLLKVVSSCTRDGVTNWDLASRVLGVRPDKVRHDYETAKLWESVIEKQKRTPQMMVTA